MDAAAEALRRAAEAEAAVAAEAAEAEAPLVFSALIASLAADFYAPELRGFQLEFDALMLAAAAQRPGARGSSTTRRSWRR